MAAIVGVPTWEIVRLESVAEEVAQSGIAAERYPSAFVEALAVRATNAVGLKSVLAYRGGFAIDPSRPTDGEVIEAAGRWLAASDSGPSRLTAPILLRFGIWAGADLARQRRLPLQF